MSWPVAEPVRPPLAWYGGSWAYSDPDPPAAPTPPAPRPVRVVSQSEFGAALPPGEATGVILGRFAPPHVGHQYLVDFARQIAGKLTIFVRTTADDPIAGELREAWLAEMFPDLKVVAVEHPDPVKGQEAMWMQQWASLVRKRVRKLDYVFGSEQYGPSIAVLLRAQYIPVDPDRIAVPISSTEIRRDPWAHVEFLPPCVRAHYTRRVVLIGPESTFKSSLAASLAERFGTLFAAEYARTLAPNRPWKWEPGDLQRIASGQLALIESQARRATKVLFCDGDLLSISLWSQRLFRNVPSWIAAQVQQMTPPAFYLLMEPDVPYFGDPEFNQPAERQAFFDTCVTALERWGWPYIRLNRTWADRYMAAVNAVEERLLRV